MKTLQERFKIVEEHVNENNIKVMIIGLGSVGAYLLIILLVKTTPTINIVVVGRDEDKMKTKVNIIRVSGLIRGVNKSRIDIEAGVDLKLARFMQFKG